MNYKAQLLHLKGQRKQKKSQNEPEINKDRNIDVVSQLIDYQLDHITIKV